MRPVHVINAITPAEAVVEAVHVCARLGEPAFARGLKAREILNPTITISKPDRLINLDLDIEGRKLNMFIAAAEAAQLVGQTSRPELMTDRIKKMADYTDDGLFHGAYGSRIAGSLPRMVNLLRADPSTRQAVVSIYASGIDDGQRFHDIPCTLTLQFFIRDGGLCMRTSMRSNDVWLGLPYDLFQFITLQLAISQALEIPVGWYAHTVGSMHMYENDVDRSANVRLALPEMKNRVPYPYFTKGTIGTISQTMRRLLDNPRGLDEYTPFEKLLSEMLNR